MCAYVKDEEKLPSLAYKVLSAKNTKKLMSVEDVDDLAWLAISYTLCSYPVFKLFCFFTSDGVYTQPICLCIFVCSYVRLVRFVQKL